MKTKLLRKLRKEAKDFYVIRATEDPRDCVKSYAVCHRHGAADKVIADLSLEKAKWICNRRRKRYIIKECIRMRKEIINKELSKL